jgi:hypothetical protein
MTSRIFAKTEETLASWARDPRLDFSEPGKDWLIIAMDPFHDRQLTNLRGYPDNEVGSSIVQIIKQSVQISATSGGGAAPAAPWDCHIALVPTLNVAGLTNSSPRQNNVMGFADNANQLKPFGGLMAQAAFTSGAPVDWNPSFVSTGRLAQLALDEAYNSGLSRVIGIGFEVCDTTADLYRQGSCMVYRQSEPRCAPAYYGLLDTTLPTDKWVTGGFTGQPLRLPPRTTQEAALFPGTEQWAAEEGCYIPAILHSIENAPIMTNYTQPVWYAAGQQDTLQANAVLPTPNTTSLYFPYPQWIGQTVSVTGIPTPQEVRAIGMPPHKIFNYHQCGAIFTGLNPQSTLTINFNVIIETFPSISEKNLLVLATPSPYSDPIALKIYSECAQKAMAGYRFKDNGLGKAFAEMVAIGAPLVSKVLQMIPHPIAQAAAAALPIAGNIAKESLVSNGSHKIKEGQLVKKKNRKKKINKAQAKQNAPGNSQLKNNSAYRKK